MWGWLRLRRSREGGAADQLREAQDRYQQARRERPAVNEQAEQLHDLAAEEFAARIARAFGRWSST